MNADLTVHLTRAPIGGWVGIGTAAVVDAAGGGIASTQLFDAGGRLGQSASTLVVERRASRERPGEQRRRAQARRLVCSPVAGRLLSKISNDNNRWGRHERLDDDRLLHRPSRSSTTRIRTSTSSVRSARCCTSPTSGVVAVTGYDEAIGDLPRPRHVLVVQLGDRPVRDVPGAARGRRRQRHRRRSYRDQLPMHEHMVTMDPPDHTPRARADHAAAHAAAPPGQRGVHVAPRRPAARRVRRRRPAASSSARTPSRSPCSSSPTCSACPRTTTSGSARASASPAPSARSAPARDGSPEREPARRGSTTWFARVHRGPPARSHARTCSPSWRWPTYPDGTTPEVTVGRAHRHVPVRRRPGDHRPPARRRAEVPRRAPRRSRTSCAPTAS